MIDPDAPDPLYVQLADLIQGRIERGELRPNRPIPSIATLHQETGLARNTIVKTLRVLVDRELIRIVPGRGAYVRER